MNTGHTGAGGTIHANSAGAVPARLAAMGALAGLGREALALQAGSALDLVVHLERGPAGRRIREIALLQLDRDGSLQAVPALAGTAGGAVPGPGWEALAARLYPQGVPGTEPAP
jgi:pilus assembly protein CpaF